MMSSVAKGKFNKTKVIFRHHTKGVSSQVLSNSDLEIKNYPYSNFIIKMGKIKEVGKNFLGYKKGR